MDPLLPIHPSHPANIEDDGGGDEEEEDIMLLSTPSPFPSPPRSQSPSSGIAVAGSGSDDDVIIISSTSPPNPPPRPKKNRYDEQKRRDWIAFHRFLDNHQPRLTLSRVRSTHVIEFLKSVDGFGKTLVHEAGCPHYGRPDAPLPPCSCPLRQSWGSLDALIGRLRAACEESPVRPDTNPFGVRTVRDYLLHIKDVQANARGIPYSRKRKAQTNPIHDHLDVDVALDAAAAAAAPAQAEAAIAAPTACHDPAAAVLEASIPPPEGDPASATVDASSGASSVPPPGIVPLVGSIGQDAQQLPLQICWVRPPVMDNHPSVPFFPVWRYPGIQSLVPFLPPFPYMPTPPPQRRMETEIRVKEELITEEDDPDADLLITREGPSSSNEGGGVDATQAATENSVPPSQQKNRYEEQKRRDWNSFLRFLENHQPPLTLSKVRSAHVLEFLKSVDQFGKTLVHEPGCPYYGNPNPPAPCGCPLRQSWGSLDALNGRLRAACEECPNRPETNPFGVRIIRNYLLHIKDSQATARGIPYSRKKKRDLPAASAEGPQGDGQNLLAVDASTELPRDPLEGAGDGPPESAAVAVMADACMGEEASDNLGGSSCDYGVDDFTSAVFSPPIISVAGDGSSDLPCASSSPSSL